MIGKTLSHYRISTALGAGGMGEVYQATDLNLNREVAIKVLPQEVSEDPERLARFRREAHLLAALNHPHIAAIYGLEEAEGQPFLAMELIEGEDLKERLARGAIPVDEALEIAAQIAEALEAAHEKGIVHRDLKPANVKLTADGKVKVLDFGLAKAWSGDEPDGSSPSVLLSQSPTLARTATMAGVILGTAAYMSPEQARGKSVDRRADIWAFGVLVWEMLTGQALFPGDTVTDVIAAVVTKEPDLEALPAATPAAVRSLLERCLRKDPRRRLPEIGSARLELQDILSGTMPELGVPAAAGDEGLEKQQRSRSRERWGWAALALVLAGLAAALAWIHFHETAEPMPAARFAIDAPEGWSIFSDWASPMPSPDGRQILFAARPAANRAENDSLMLSMRSLESLDARLLTGTEEAESVVAWSPDSRFVAFFTENHLRRLHLADGTVQTVCDAPPGRAGIDWNADGTLIFSAGGGEGRIYSVAASGGEARLLMTPDASRGEQWHHLPQFLPDGRRFLFGIEGSTDEAPGLYLSSLDSPDEKRKILPGFVRRVYAAGHLLYVREGTLFAQPFDPERVEVRGDPVAIASPVASWSVNPDMGWFGVADSRALAYLSGATGTAEVQLSWFDRAGRVIETAGEPGVYGQIVLSPDERNVAIEIRDPESGYDLWVMDVERGVSSRVTVGPGDERNPVWAPDGRSLAFSHLLEGATDIRRKGLRVGDPETVLVDTEAHDYPEVWSSDGLELLFVKRETDSGLQSLLSLSLEEGAEPEILESTGFTLDEPQVSPDGRWLAFNSEESGRSEVYVEPYRRDGERVRISPDGGGQPKWRGDGGELFFATLDGQLMSVTFQDRNDRAEVGLPTPLFEIGAFQGPQYDDYAPSADGQRFLVKVPVEQPETAAIHVVTNWTSLLD